MCVERKGVEEILRKLIHPLVGAGNSEIHRTWPTVEILAGVDADCKGSLKVQAFSSLEDLILYS